MISTILLVFALVLAILGAWPLPSRINLLSAAFACYVASLLLGRL
jgi:hypothetical protein